MNKHDLLRGMNRDIYCRLRASPIHGVGVFAVRAIPEGTKPFVGSDERPSVPVREADLSGLDPAIRALVDDYCAVQGGRVWLPPGGFNALDVQYYVNHSDEPNLTTPDNGNTFVTSRDIAVGEELTVDYGTFNDRGDWQARDR